MRKGIVRQNRQGGKTFSLLLVLAVVLQVFGYVPEVHSAGEPSIDYPNEIITFDESVYVVNESNDGSGTEITNNSSISEYIGSTIYYTTLENSSEWTSAEEINLSERPEAPSGISSTSASSSESSDGSITGVDNTMEYKLASGSAWNKVNDTTITGIVAGSYQVRYKATDSSFASVSVEVEVSVQQVTIPSEGEGFTVDYVNETITPESGYEVTVNGSKIEEAISITDDLDAGEVTVKVKLEGAQDENAYSNNLSRGDAPSGISSTSASSSESSDGSITGVDNTMEYKLASGSAWNKVNDTTITGLVAGSYQVRYKATDSSFASKVVEVEVSVQQVTIPSEGEGFTVDYANETITPESGYEVTVNGSKIEEAISITDDLDAGEVTVKVKLEGAQDENAYSNNLSRGDAPSGISSTSASSSESSDGSITGVDDTMEYKLASGSAWNKVNDTTITDLAVGSYQVRYKATDNSFASKVTEVEVGAIIVPTYTAPTLTALYGQTLEQLTSQLGTPTTQDGTNIAGSWSWDDGNDTTVGDAGTKSFSATFTPDDTQLYSKFSVDINVIVEVDKSSWGNKVEVNGVTNYISDDGITSAEVDKNDKIWLKEESGDTIVWYKIDNSEGVFRLGSRFWIHLLDKDIDASEYEKYYEQLDDEHKSLVDSGKLQIFLIGVTDPDGNEYTQLETSVKVYFQLIDDWNKNNLQALYIRPDTDEIVSIEYAQGVSSPDGKGEFAMLTLNHFSPYAVYDKVQSQDSSSSTGNNTSSESQVQGGSGASSEGQNNDSLDYSSSDGSGSVYYIDEDSDYFSSYSGISTGDQMNYWLVIGIVCLVLTTGSAVFILRKKNNRFTK